MPEQTLWFCLIFEVSAEAGDEDSGEKCGMLTASLLDAGIESTEVRETGDGKIELVTYLKADSPGQAANRARAINLYLPREAVENTRLEAVDPKLWTENWKEHFAPIEVGRRLLVLPPWEAPTLDQADRRIVIINPGLAFGTGNHETTLGCLELLEKYIRGGERVADVGTGSGILAISAMKLGAAEAFATDTDPEAVNAATENAVINEVSGGFHVAQVSGPPAVEGSGGAFDIVLANILAGTLLSMADALTSCVKKSGLLVLSGIESARLPLIEVAFTRRGFTPVEELIKEGWAILALGTAEQTG